MHHRTKHWLTNGLILHRISQRCGSTGGCMNFSIVLLLLLLLIQLESYCSILFPFCLCLSLVGDEVWHTVAGNTYIFKCTKTKYSLGMKIISYFHRRNATNILSKNNHLLYSLCLFVLFVYFCFYLFATGFRDILYMHIFIFNICYNKDTKSYLW